MIQVFDACAMIAYLRNEPGGDVAKQILNENIGFCIAHSVRALDERTAKAALRDLRRAGIRTRRDIGRAFWMRIGEIKAVRRVSLGDCFAIQLARDLRGEVVTSDHHEFDSIAAERVCKVRFIR